MLSPPKLPPPIVFLPILIFGMLILGTVSWIEFQARRTALIGALMALAIPCAAPSTRSTSPEMNDTIPLSADLTPDTAACAAFSMVSNTPTILCTAAERTPEANPASQLATRAVPPSNLSLLGLVRHMSGTERGWVRQTFRGEQIPDLYYRSDAPDADFEEADPAGAEEDFERHRAECRAVDAALEGAKLDDTFTFGEKTTSVRWMWQHLVEEYARHNGHADLLREAIDGSAGL